MEPLNAEEIKKSLSELSGWFYLNNSIEKEYKLKSFADAVALVVKIGMEAEKLGHHPNLLLHSWNKVKVTLTTHELRGVSEYDIKLAQNIDEIRK
jgi:4a-hydroxytetrahydrobiopterin dehydratase